MTKGELGPYRLVEPVLTRALTVTYRAEHETLGRRVWIKTLKPTVAVGSPFAHDLDREAKLLARIRHDAIIELYDFVRSDTQVYLVLEDVGGSTLAEVMARAGKLEPLEAGAIALELSRGLGHAHERGVVHKGIRPEVVQITPAGRVKIVDFSGSHDIRTPSIPEPFEGDSTFHRPDYMAPEQILGEDAGPETDVFALGILLYEMLAGVRPFDERAAEDAPAAGATAAASGPPRKKPESRDVALRIRSVAPRPIAEVAAGVPRPLERVIARCLAKRREDRYQDGRDLTTALEEALGVAATLPTRVLVSRALAAAKLGDELPAPGAAVAHTPIIGVPSRSMLPAVRGLAVVFALIVFGGAVIEVGLRDEEAPERPGVVNPAAPASRERGFLKVLARPWAEVFVDGELVEVTPVARPIPVAIGKRFVTFKHPNAPDEKRTVKVVAGQTVLLDVTMRVQRPDAGARLPDASDSP